MILYKHLPIVFNDTDTNDIHNLNIKRCEAIRDNRYWFSNPAKLNDPFECLPLFSKIEEYEDVCAIIENLEEHEVDSFRTRYPSAKNTHELLEIYRQFVSVKDNESLLKSLYLMGLQSFATRLVRSKMSNVGVLSFTETYQSCLMWAHYSRNHEGICIEIDIPENAQGLNKVTYAEQQPQIALYEAMDQKYGKIEQLFYHKSYPWHYEKEWRIVSLEGNKLGEIENSQIKKIHYGLNTSEETKIMINSIVGNSIVTNQVKLKPNYTIS